MATPQIEMSSHDLSGFTEAVVVLANLMDVDGRLNAESVARLAVAADLVKGRPQACLITTGWNYRPDSPIKIAHAFRDSAQADHCIAPQRIIADIWARDTVGDAVFVKRNLIEASPLRTLTVVSSDYHMARVTEIFQFVFGPDYRLSFAGAETPHAPDIDMSEARSLEAFRTTFAGVAAGDIEAIYDRLVRDHPFYNGVVHPAL